MKHFRNWEGSTALVAPASRLAKYTRDAFQTFDAATMDSAGAFLVGELERLDPTIHLPLSSVTWQRDLDLRTDVQIGDETASYTLSSFGQAGGVNSNGINWASKDGTAIPRATLDIGKIANPLNLVTYEVSYTIPELKSSEQTGRPIDTQMLAAMSLKNQMDADQVAYIGDPAIILASGSALSGLVNSALVTNITTVPADGTASSTYFSAKTPAQILRDVNTLLISVWSATGYSEPPSKLLFSPTVFGYLSTTPVSIGTTGTAETILTYLKTRNILTAEKDIPIEINAVKWLDKTVRGAGSDRAVAYIQKPNFVRFPLVPIQPVAPQFRGIWVAVPYYGRIGVTEVVYPETVGYIDGLA